jgi:hypothetical protein
MNRTSVVDVVKDPGSPGSIVTSATFIEWQQPSTIFLEEIRMKRLFMLSFVMVAFAIQVTATCQGQPPSSEALSPYWQQRIDAAIHDVANPNPSAIKDFIKPLIKELEVQVAYVKTKKERFLAIQLATEERLQGLMSEELKRVEQSGRIGSSRETVELLLRNCLVELQRLNWQAAAEETPTNERSLGIREQLALSQLRALEDQLMEAERQFEFQEKQFKAISELFNKGVLSEVDMHKEQAKIDEVKAALKSAQQNRETDMLQWELDRSSEVEKSQLNSKKLQQQREAIEKEIPELQKALREVAGIGNIRLAIEACEDRIRSLDRKINELMIQETELEALIEFLTSRLTPAEGK